MVFLNELFIKVDFEKVKQTTKKHEKFPLGQSVNIWAITYAQLPLIKANVDVVWQNGGLHALSLVRMDGFVSSPELKVGISMPKVHLSVNPSTFS